jgi:hypothetical protein
LTDQVKEFVREGGWCVVTQTRPEPSSSSASRADAGDALLETFSGPDGLPSAVADRRPVVPDLTADDDWAEFFGELDPDLVFECSATLSGDHHEVRVYPDRVHVEGPEIPEGTQSVPLSAVTGWALVVQGSVVVLTLQAGHPYRIRVPKAFRSVLRTALLKVLGDSEGV